MHRKLLERIEDDCVVLNRDHLERACLLLQSDHWSVDARLDDRRRLDPGRIAALEAERDRIAAAMRKIAARIQHGGRCP